MGWVISQAGIINISGGGGGGTPIETLTTQDGHVVPPTANNINVSGGTAAAGSTPVTTVGNIGTSTVTTNVQISQAIASTDATKIGLAAFNSTDFTVDANGFVSSKANAFAYTNVTHAMSPYTVLTTDYYLSVDCSAGVVTLNFPNAATAYQEFVVKDRTGNASTNHISVTTVGGAVTIDGQTTYLITSNYGAIQLLGNGTTYEVF